MGVDRQEYADARARIVPLGRQGTAWDVAGAATVGYLQTAVARLGDSHGADSVATGATKVMAIVSIIVWLGATVTGRLIAYL